MDDHVEPVHGDEGDRPDLDQTGLSPEAGKRVTTWIKTIITMIRIFLKLISWSSGAIAYVWLLPILFSFRSICNCYLVCLGYIGSYRYK